MTTYIMMVLVLHTPTNITPVSREVPNCKVAQAVEKQLQADKEAGKILDFGVMCAPFKFNKYLES